MRADLEAWVTAYERAWRTPGVEPLAALFTPDATYLVSPWKEPLVGLEAIGEFWDSGRDGADERFTLTSEVVAVEGDVGVERVAIDYGTGNRWRDLWVVTLDDDGRCRAFEEWPFAPGQHDGQGP